MAVDPRRVTASYIHLHPYRTHLIRFDVVSRQIEFLSDPNEWNVATSGWHGTHDWAPRCRDFTLRDFRFLGQNAQFHCNMEFHLQAFSAGHNIWRYTGYMLGMVGRPIAEIIIEDTDNVPSLALPGAPSVASSHTITSSGSQASTSTATPAGANSSA